jgi:pyrroloquinoline quinone (PQQ) biosynthesis protein C
MKPGLYEQVINRLLDIRLGDKKYKVETEKIEVEESSKILSKYLAEILEKGLSNLKDSVPDISAQTEFCNKIIDDLVNAADPEELKDQSIEKRAEMLFTFLENQNAIHAVNNRA